MAYKICCGVCESSRVEIVESPHGGPFFNIIRCRACKETGLVNGLTIHYYEKPKADTRKLALADLRTIEAAQPQGAL